VFVHTKPAAQEVERKPIVFQLSSKRPRLRKEEERLTGADGKIRLRQGYDGNVEQCVWFS
jgi:hypothetical protein